MLGLKRTFFRNTKLFFEDCLFLVYEKKLKKIAIKKTLAPYCARSLFQSQFWNDLVFTALLNCLVNHTSTLLLLYTVQKLWKFAFTIIFPSLLSVKILPNQQKITKSYVFTKYFPNESKIFVFPHCVALKSTLLSTSIGHVSFTHPFYSRRQNPHTIHLYFINSLLSYSVDNTNFPTPIIMPFCLQIWQCCQLYLKIVNI